MTNYSTPNFVFAHFDPARTANRLSLPMAYPAGRDQKSAGHLNPMESQKDLPENSLQIGVCTDGLPFLLNLQDPGTGPVLITGDARSGKTQLLQAMVLSAVHLNSPEDVQYAVITSNPSEWADFEENHLRSGHCRGVFGVEDPDANQLVLEMSILVEDRLNGAAGRPVIMLVIDDLDPLLDADLSDQANLHWLFDQGPQAKIWPILAINSERAFNLHYWVNLFRTRLIGAIRSQTVAQRLAIRPGVLASHLLPGRQFTAWLNGHWVKFWLVESIDRD